jgi:hypothetical protein
MHAHLLAVLLLLGPPEAAAAPPSQTDDLAARSRALYERLKTLEGSWRGRSTKGWTETGTYRTIAGGSVVMNTSFDAHPNETMITMYHLDGDRLLLTHYCVARNQPRLLATEISPDLSRVVFTFLDATNLPTRDVGHMDQCVIEFDGPDRFTEQWTWYAKGRESWMERIVNERVPGEPTSAPAADGRP